MEKKIIKKNSLKVELVSKKIIIMYVGEMYVNRTKICICELMRDITKQMKTFLLFY